MTYNYGKQIRVCSKVSYILKENNDAGDLSASPRIEGKKKKKDCFTVLHRVEEHDRGFTRDDVCTKRENKCP